MAKTYTAANVDQWLLDSERRLDLLVKQSTNDLLKEATRVVPGTNRGGTIRPGFVPRDTGYLAGSLVSSVHGGIVQRGEDSHILVIASMRAGDDALFGWVAKYARPVHYRGWLWVDNAAAQWRAIVERVAERLRGLDV